MRCPILTELPAAPAERKGWPWTEETRPLPPARPDGSAWPKISIVTPSFNQGEFLEETIRSVLLQGYPNLEYIIIDGASTDNSAEIIRKYEPWLAYWVSEKDHGCTHAVAKGFTHATGELFGIMPAGDFYCRDGFFSLLQSHNANPSSVAWVGGCPEIDSKGTVVNPGKPIIRAPELIGDWGAGAWFGSLACLFSAQAFSRVGGFDERFKTANDVELWLRLSKIGSFSLTDKIVASARFDPNSLSHRDWPAEVTALIALNYVNGDHGNAKNILLRYAKQHALPSVTPAEVCDFFSTDDLVKIMGRQALAKAVIHRISGALRRRWKRAFRL